ncbi:MAG: FGGY-family carbohydrate kinase [Lachnospiraceae bacterium]
MKEKYIISIDQSTQGTKALLFDSAGTLVRRTDKAHQQIINEKGWISHDPMEIYQNTLTVVRELVEQSGIDTVNIAGIGISNQRESAMAWDKVTGQPLGNAIVWQCARAEEICERVANEGHADKVRQHTGINLSPYFPAAKIAWIIENQPGAKEKAERGEICYGTMDTWIVYQLTGGKAYKTDYSNASRTQLFDIFKLQWDEEICGMFGIDPHNLAEVCDSDAHFGDTDFGGLLPHPVPIHSVLGDSHGALFGQGCLKPGMMKATYGTGSSIMMNVGEKPVVSSHGVVSSLAWRMGGKVNYVLEGNLNYTGAVITWMKDDLKLIQSPGETEQLAKAAVTDDQLYLVPAFSGLGAPYWDSRATAAISGMTRTTGKAEIVRAGLECIAYQITDIVTAMCEDAKMPVKELRVDGGPTRNGYLMQFQSDIAQTVVQIPDSEELSGIGPAYAAGLALGVWDEEIFRNIKRTRYEPQMDETIRRKKYRGWEQAVASVLEHE